MCRLITEMFFLILILCTTICAATGTVNRNELIHEAIRQVDITTKNDHTSKAASIGNAVTPMALLEVLRHASNVANDQGNARLKFENAVKLAERKILAGKQQLYRYKGPQAKLEELAKELLHTPGTILTDDELTFVYEQSGCTQFPTDARTSCSRAEAWMYRSATGVCNNLQAPLFGKSGSPLRRLIFPQYEDGISQPRGTFQAMGTSLVTGGPFSPPNPSARLVSTSVVQDRKLADERYTNLLMQWGQFLHHDLVFTPAFQDLCEGCTYTDRCAPIAVPNGDQLLGDSTSSQTCQSFIRSIPVCSGSRTEGFTPIVREQINEQTSFIDGSQIYGSSTGTLNRLREAQSGRLRTGSNIPENGGASLPLDTDGVSFLAGDARVNEHIGLIVMHTLWLREHNRIADRLREINPYWHNETIFQTSRRIVEAELQKITFKDYLPILLGEGYSLISNYSNVGYQNNTNPSIPNAFTTAAFRFGHSQVQPSFVRLDNNFEPTSTGPLSLSESFFNPREYANSNGTDPILRGMLTNSVQKVDEFVNEVLTNHLFQTNNSAPGLDLASIDIQRGRDHGLPPYIIWKRWAESECGITSDLDNEITMIRFLQTYGTIETVDLYVGGLAEKSLPGGIIGATFACIVAKTFESLRNGDRFYYENNDSTTGIFSPQQRETFENTSLARIICNNADNIDSIQSNAFQANQTRVPCSSLPDMDLKQWSSPCYIKLRVNQQRTDINFHSHSVLNGPALSYSSTILRGGRQTCLEFQCPRNGQNTTRLSVHPAMAMGMCRSSRNTQLPPSLARNSRNYIATITPMHINSRSGIYGDMTSCINGKQFALKYRCGGDQTQVQEVMQELENALETSDVEKVTYQEWLSMKLNSRNYNSSLLPMEINHYSETEMKDFNTYVQKDEVSSTEVIRLLEKALSQLKEAKSQQDDGSEDSHKTFTTQNGDQYVYN